MRLRDYLAGYIRCYSADYAQLLPLKGSSKRQSYQECWLESVFRILVTRHASCGGPNSHLGAGLGGRGVLNTTIARRIGMGMLTDAAFSYGSSRQKLLG
jgi:hypothetical protein